MRYGISTVTNRAAKVLMIFLYFLAAASGMRRSRAPLGALQ
jgi:hypothetical protein